MEAAPKGEPLRLPGRSKDHKWLVHSGSQHSNGNEDDKRLVPNCRHSFWCKDDERLVPPAVALIQAAATGAKGKTRFPGWSKDHKWLVHTSFSNLLGARITSD